MRVQDLEARSPNPVLQIYRQSPLEDPRAEIRNLYVLSYFLIFVIVIVKTYGFLEGKTTFFRSFHFRKESEDTGSDN